MLCNKQVQEQQLLQEKVCLLLTLVFTFLFAFQVLKNVLYMWVVWTELFLCFCFCFFDKVQQLEQEKFSLEGAIQELSQVGFFFFLLFVPDYAQFCNYCCSLYTQILLISKGVNDIDI